MSQAPPAQAASVARARSRRFPSRAWATSAAARSPLAAVLVAALAAIVPAWEPVWYQDDQLPTLFRTFHTDLAHHWGVLYPRLAPELGFGYGRLLHQFYPPFGVELAAWLHTLGLGYVDAARATFSLCLLASALGMHAYAGVVLGGRWRPALAAVDYVWAPYVLLDAHKGGVLGESIALAIMPWALLALHRLVTRGGLGAFVAAALGLGLVVLGHNITALFFVGLASVYAALLAGRTWLTESAHRRRAAGRVQEAGAEPPLRGAFPTTSSGQALGRLMLAAGAVGLALTLSAVYWLPALAELPYSRVSEQRTGDFVVTRYLLAPADLLQPALIFDYFTEAVPRFGLVAGLLTLVGAAAFALAAARPGARGEPGGLNGTGDAPDRLVVGAFVVCFVVVLLLQLRVAAPIWETVPLISYVQFPQRLFVFGAFAGAVVLGALPWAVVRLARRPGLASAAGLAAALALGATSLPGVYWPWPVAGSHVISEDEVGIWTSADRRLSERSAFDDYFPAWVQEDANQIIRPASPSRSELYAAASVGRVPRVEAVERGYLGLTLRTEADEPSVVVLHAFYFPGWQAAAGGQPLGVEPAGPLGLVRVSVPPGAHAVRVWFGETSLRLAATVVSLLGLGLLLYLAVRAWGARRTLLGVAALAALVLVPRLLHTWAAPVERPPARQVQADVLPSARVIGVEVAEGPASQGVTVPITLLWQATAYNARDLQSGVRLVPPGGGSPVAERWGRPNRERTPTNKWLVGEIVPDTLFLRLPADLPPGEYRLLAGLRDPDSRDRAPLGQAEIGTLLVR